MHLLRHQWPLTYPFSSLPLTRHYSLPSAASAGPLPCGGPSVHCAKLGQGVQEMDATGGLHYMVYLTVAGASRVHKAYGMWGGGGTVNQEARFRPGPESSL